MMSILLSLTTLSLLITFTYTNVAPKPEEKLDPKALFSIPMDMWHCGSQMVGLQIDITQLAIREINDSCPDHAGDLNHCCAIHDDCYTQQMGQELCDQNFCDCTQNVIHKNSKARRCSQFSMLSCRGVKVYGVNAYSAVNASATPSTLLPLEQRRVPNIERIGLEYAELYENCVNQNLTIASCALNHDNCRQGSQKCTIELMKCLEDTKRDREPNDLCDKVIDKINKELMHPSVKNDDDDGEYTVVNGYFINQTAYLRSAGADGSAVVAVIFCSLVFLVCIVGILAGPRLSKKIFYDDIEPTKMDENVSMTAESTKRN